MRGTVAVVTGGASGIGRALAQRFAADQATAVIVADLDGGGAAEVAGRLGGPTALGVRLDVTVESEVAALVERVEAEVGPIDVWCSNAGVIGGPDLGADREWEACWRVHVLAHVYAARAVLPRMVARGRGRFLVTASAAGLLTEIDAAPYAVTKHGSVALAEWLAIQHGDAGVNVHCLCPQAVRTPLLAGAGSDAAAMAAGVLIEPEQVADAVVTAFAENRFLILPHPEVAEYERRRAGDRDRWLAGMRRFRVQRSGAQRSGAGGSASGGVG